MRKIDFSNMSVVKDIYGRSFKTLRVSLLNNCNLGGVYCTMGDSEIKEISASRKLSFTSSKQEDRLISSGLVKSEFLTIDRPTEL